MASALNEDVDRAEIHNDVWVTDDKPFDICGKFSDGGVDRSAVPTVGGKWQIRRASRRRNTSDLSAGAGGLIVRHDHAQWLRRGFLQR